jgi:hypothetical protein
MTDRPAPAGATTHDVEIAGEVVTKRFRRWDRGEPAREWNALHLLAEHAPGLAPAPVRADLEAHPPTIEMSRLRGHPVGSQTVDDAQLDAIVAATERLHTAVPARIVQDLAPRIWSQSQCLEEVRAWFDRRPELGADPIVAAACRRASRWLSQASLDAAVLANPAPVFGRADGNLANLLWDGVAIRIVDFEDSGRSDRVFELADLVEHIQTRAAGIAADRILDRVELDHAERGRLVEHRRLFASFWFLMLLPGGPAAARNPPGSLERQAAHLLELLA